MHRGHGDLWGTLLLSILYQPRCDQLLFLQACYVWWLVPRPKNRDIVQVDYPALIPFFPSNIFLSLRNPFISIFPSVSQRNWTISSTIVFIRSLHIIFLLYMSLLLLARVHTPFTASPYLHVYLTAYGAIPNYFDPYTTFLCSIHPRVCPNSFETRYARCFRLTRPLLSSCQST